MPKRYLKSFETTSSGQMKEPEQTEKKENSENLQTSNARFIESMRGAETKQSPGVS